MMTASNSMSHEPEPLGVAVDVTESSYMGLSLLESAYISVPPPPPPTPPAPPPQRQVRDPRNGAQVIRDGFGPSIAASLATGMASIVGVPSFQEFRSEMIRELGDPLDPIARLFLDQLCWLHFRGAELLASSAGGRLPAEQAGIYIAAAARLFAEFRKSALALREYRAPVRQPSTVTVVANNNTQVAVMDGKATVQTAEEKVIDSEVGSKQPAALTHEQPQSIIPQRQSRASRSTEPCPARPAHRAGAKPSARSRVAEPTVAQSDGAEDACR